MPSGAPPTQPWSQVSVVHSDSTSGRCAFQVGPLCFTSLLHCKDVCSPFGAARTVPGSLASAFQPISLAHLDDHTWLCDSARQASPQVQQHLVYFSGRQGWSCPACRDCGPTGRHNIAGPSSRYEVMVLQPILHCSKKGGGLWPILDLHILNQALHKLPFKMLMQKNIFECIHPQV